jgi:SAM-dependent MidA family methyltransferase
MLADMLRAARAVPGFVEAARIACVEASPLLRAEQAARLQGFAPAFAADLGEVADGPMLLAANEFLDCLAVRQLVETPSGWRERAVGLDAEGRLAFGVGLPAEPPDLTAPAGGALEVAPAMETLTALLADRFSRHPGRALFIDYGPADASPGDTLRAFVNGRQVGPLDFPGEADLTSDVDFQRLKRLALRAGLAVHGPVTQRDFLLRLGARERAEALAAANPAHAAEIELALARLTEPEAMGERFKALCVSAPRLPPPAGFPLHGAPR